MANISFTLKFWRQNGPKAEGHFDTREMKNIPDDTSFLEMLDILNEELIEEGKEPFVFDHDCREGETVPFSISVEVHTKSRSVPGMERGTILSEPVPTKTA